MASANQRAHAFAFVYPSTQRILRCARFTPTQPSSPAARSNASTALGKTEAAPQARRSGELGQLHI